jgi:hypothetical protein
MNRARRALGAAVAATALAATCAPATTAAATRATDASPVGRPMVTYDGRSYPAPNPYLAELPIGQKVDWAYWRRALAAGARHRVTRTTAAVPAPASYAEREPVGAIGENDVQPRAERIADLGVRRPFQGALVTGRLSAPPVAGVAIRTAEDQGSIPLATATGIGDRRGSVSLASRIGDGPFGSTGSGRGDFDFFKVRGVAGGTITANTLGSRLDTTLVLYDATGDILEINDDASDTVLQSSLRYDVTGTADYYLMVAGFSDDFPTPSDPLRSDSGRGVGDEGAYRLEIASRPVDRDYYGVRLHAGDVLAGSLTGHARTVTVHRVDGRRMIGSQEGLSSLYPVESPLPGGGADFSYVAEEPGWYAVSARGGTGRYRLLLETYRPGMEREAAGAVQTVFLDFDGARVNTSVFGGPGVTTLSPLGSFLRRWGLTRRDNAALIAHVVGTVKENLRDTLAARGLNAEVRVRVLNSRNHPDPTGRPDVSRVVVGGTVKQAGLPTIGIAQSIDPGNFAHRESALVLLDILSGPASTTNSINAYLGPGSDRVAFVGEALGNVVSHEVGHLLGSFHTDDKDRTVDLMDAHVGVGRLFGVGQDRIGGTADDVDVNVGEDRFLPEEGLTGLEDTLNTSAWGLRPGASR